MKKQFLLITICTLLFAISLEKSFAQIAQKVQFNGLARSLIVNNNLEIPNAPEDTITPKKEFKGNTLLDLSFNIFPNDQTEINGQIRINNQLGGFWGGGTTFLVRQLYLKGIIAHTIRYQFGDINYKLTPYTFWSPEEELTINDAAVFKMQKEDVIYYEHYYRNNTWRQQGANVDFALQFPKFIKEIQFNGFASRLLANQAPPTPVAVHDRLFSGGNIGVKQSENFLIGVNYVDLFDLKGVTADSVIFHNPVMSGNFEYNLPMGNSNLKFFGESGNSKSYYENDTASPVLKDWFVDAGIGLSNKPSHLTFKISYANVGPDFRSAGSQTKRINFNGTPAEYSRYTNEQILRDISLFEAMKDEGIYNNTLTNTLMPYEPSFDNILPYGKATPNRQGINFNLAYEMPENKMNLALQYSMLQEIVGEGTEKLKKFSLWKAAANVNVNKFISYSKNFKITFGYQNGNTQRSTDENYSTVKLNSSVIDVGIELEIFKNMDVLAGTKMFNSKGNELIPLRNLYTLIRDFNEHHSDFQQTLNAIGLRYRFTEKIYLTAQYQMFNLKNKLDEKINYNIQQWMVMYSMKF